MAVPTTAPTAEFQDGGKPVAGPCYLVDSNGNPIGSTNPATVVIETVAGTALAPGSAAVPILNSAAPGYVVAYGSNPAALTANTDYSFKWGTAGTTQVNHIMIQNNSGTTINFDLDVAATAGSPTLANGSTIFFDVQATAVHLLSTGTPNVNGATGNNVVVRGWL